MLFSHEIEEASKLALMIEESFPCLCDIESCLHFFPKQWFGKSPWLLLQNFGIGCVMFPNLSMASNWWPCVLGPHILGWGHLVERKTLHLTEGSQTGDQFRHVKKCTFHS